MLILSSVDKKESAHTPHIRPVHSVPLPDASPSIEESPRTPHKANCSRSERQPLSDMASLRDDGVHGSERPSFYLPENRKSSCHTKRCV